MSILLGVNIDHIASIRESRKVDYPNLIDAAIICQNSGADAITMHLREDRRHIQDHDIYAVKKAVNTKINLEMAATTEMINIALNLRPDCVCIVPEKRQELTTEGGLDILKNITKITELCQEMKKSNIHTSLFVDSNAKQIEAAKRCGTQVIEINTGFYANGLEQINNIAQGSQFAHNLGLQVNAGHGLTIDNVQPIAGIAQITELNIGHSIVARSVFIGLKNAVTEMKELILQARNSL